MSKNILFILLFLLMSISISSAYTPIKANATLTSFLTLYIPNYNSSMQLYQSNSTNYFILNVTGNYVVINANNANGYNFVTNQSSIYSIISPIIITNNSKSSALINKIRSGLDLFITQSNPSIASCLQETGLNQKTQSCTLANQCSSCQTVPVCKKVMDQVGGPSSPFGLGIMNFSNKNANLNTNYSAAFSDINNSNSAGLQSSISNVKSIVSVIQNNPIFPYQSNFSSTQLQGCYKYPNQNTAPWYCVDIGYCENLKFNQTLLNNLSSQSSQLSSLSSSTPSPTQLSLQSSLLAKSYIANYTNRLNNQQAINFLSKVSPEYNSIISKSKQISNNVTNSTLLFDITNLETIYSNIKSSNATAITDFNSSYLQLSDLTTSLSAAYKSANSKSEVNTNSLIVQQFNYEMAPPNIALLISDQQSYNQQLLSKPTYQQLLSINSSESALSNNMPKGVPFSMALFTKGLFGAIASSSINPSSSTSSIINSSTIYALIIPLIIGLVIVALFYLLTYHKIKVSKKMHPTKQHLDRSRNQVIAILVIVIILSLLFYYFAIQANSFLPLGAFTSTLSASHSALIMINTTSYSQPCINAIDNTLINSGKSVNIVYSSNYTCSIGSSEAKGQICYNNLLKSNLPLIAINSNGYATYSGFVGTALQVGPSMVDNQCIAEKLLN